MSDPIRAGRSDKYGQVYVERVGNTGFSDPDEPIAVFRAQDEHAYGALLDYLRRNEQDPGVPASQVASVNRQIKAFERFRLDNPLHIRKPGVQP